MLDLSLNFDFGNDGLREKSLQEIPPEFDFSISSEFTHSSIATTKASITLSVQIQQTNSEARPDQFKFADETHTQIIYSISGDTELGLIKGVFGLRFNAKHQIILTSQHPKNTLLKDCVLKDLSAFPVLYDRQDVEGLQEGQVIGLSIDRGAELGMNFSWSNIISRSISGLSDLGLDPKTISLDIKPSLFVDLKYSLDDSLILIAKKSEGEQVEFAVTKANQKQANVNAGIKVNLKLSENTVLQRHLHDTGDQLIETILGTKLQHVETLLNEANQTKETIKNQAWYPLLGNLTKNRIDNLEIPEIRKELDSAKLNIVAKIQTAIGKNTEMAIQYEYRKTKAQNEVLHFDFPLNQIQQYHSSLINFRLSDILLAFREDKLPQSLFHQYLNQKTLSVKRSIGLGLTLFDKVLFTALGKKSKHKSITENLSGQQSIHYQVGSGYRGKLGNWSSEWYSEITLDMNGFSKVPRFQEADFSQYLSLSSGNNINTMEDLEVLLDTGVIWGAILPDQRNELASSLFKDLKDKNIEVQATIAIHGKGYISFLNQITSLARINKGSLQTELGRCLALAIPYLPQHEVRRDIKKREMAYKRVFFNFLKTPRISKNQLTNLVAEDILKTNPTNIDYQAFSRMETKDLPSSFLHIISDNKNIAEKWNTVGSQYSNFSGAISSNSQIIDVFEKIENDIRQIPSSTLHCRALGALLNNYAKRNEVIENHTTRTIEIFVAGGNTIVLSPIGGLH